MKKFLFTIIALIFTVGLGYPQITGLSGNYYIGAAGTGPGATNPDYASLKAAFDTLNKATFAGDCTFYITSDITEPNTTSGIGLAIDPGTYTVTFKPYTGIQPTVTLQYATDANSGPSGAFIIGIPQTNNIAWNDLRATRNIIIDGSNTVGGTTRDLTFQNAITTNRNGFPLVIVGDVSNVTIKNTNFFYKAQGVSTSGNLFVGAVQLRSRVNGGLDWVPNHITFDNDHMSGDFDGVVQSSQGFGCYASSPYVANYPNNITVKNSLIEGKRRGIALYKSGSFDIYGNEIKVNQNITATISCEAIYAVDVDTNSVVNIYNNKISKVSSLTSGAGLGNTAISIETFGTYNIYNNMIYGFALAASNPTAYLKGIKIASPTATLNASFNSIYMNDIADIGTGVVSYYGMQITNGTSTLRDNIVSCAEPDFATYCIYHDSTTVGAFNSDYNDFFTASATNGNVGFWGTAATKALADWRTASSQDANSISADPVFISTTDLHLLNASSPVIGKGITVAGITTDFDGQLRGATPTIGCVEFPGITPVELVSFTASVEKDVIVLKWQTASELNSKYFSIERKTSNTNWTLIGNVNAAGNSTRSINYSFADNKFAGSKASYRLKQVDLNGTYTYSNEVEINTEIPVAFGLSQNYPNPFNPTTKINYSVPVDSRVTISIYSITGQLVTELVNENITAGYHSVNFNASKLASGMYIYKMAAGNFVQIHKMMLLK